MWVTERFMKWIVRVIVMVLKLPLELCFAEIRQYENKEQYLEKIGEFLELIKEDKIDRLREMIWNIKR